MRAKLPIPESIELLTGIACEKARRPVRFRKLAAQTYVPSSVFPEKQLAPAGTVTVFLARPGSGLFKTIGAAASKPGDGEDRRAAALVLRQFYDRKPKPLEEAAALVRRQPIIAELRYGGATLVENLFVPEDLEVTVVNLPYNGGRIAPEGFTLAEYYLEDEVPSLDILVLKSEPPLSAAEKAALKAVPEDMLAINVANGPGEGACDILLLTAAVAVEVVVEWATFTLVKAFDDHSMDHINPGAIKELGPVGTARALVNLRREILQGRTGR
jgi:hypothetical protein